MNICFSEEAEEQTRGQGVMQLDLRERVIEIVLKSRDIVSADDIEMP